MAWYMSKEDRELVGYKEGGSVASTPKRKYVGEALDYVGSKINALGHAMNPSSDLAKDFGAVPGQPIPFGDLLGLTTAGPFLQDMAYEGSSPVHGGSLQTSSIDPRAIDTLSLLAMGTPGLSTKSVIKAADIASKNWQPMQQLLYHGASTSKPLSRGSISEGGLYLASSKKAAEKASEKAVSKFGGDPLVHSILANPLDLQDSSYMWGYPGGATRAYVAKDPSKLQVQQNGTLSKFKRGGLVS